MKVKPVVGETPINKAVLDAARSSGRLRAQDLSASAPRAVTEGAVLSSVEPAPSGVLVWDDDHYSLLGRRLRSGDVIEVYTTSANGWLRGRFEWSGQQGERPCLGLNLWDPEGERDADGLPPWVGDIDAPLPPRAVCRWA